VKVPNTVAETVDFVEKVVFDGVQTSDDETMRLIELMLTGGLQGRFASAVLLLHQAPDKLQIWERFVATSRRIFGPDWREVIQRSSAQKLDFPHMLACSTESCTELAWGRVCDLCLARQMGREGLV
jgi:hypothetical protein